RRGRFEKDPRSRRPHDRPGRSDVARFRHAGRGDSQRRRRARPASRQNSRRDCSGDSAERGGLNSMAAKIVVVDDSRTQRSTIAMALERRGYEVIQGSDGLEALHLVHNESPDLLISDIVMPELTGYQVCRLLKNDAATEDLPIILLTTLEHQEHRFWGKEAGADSFV